MQNSRTEILSLRVPAGTANRLRQVAHERSLKKNIEVRWSRLVLDAIKKHILEKRKEK